MAVALDITHEGLNEAMAAIAQLAEPERSELGEGIGAMMESSTKRRIADEKRSPDGEAWMPWSIAHGETRRAGQSLLVAEGDLRDSIQFVTDGAEIRIGSNLIYAATHQFGREDDGIPARPYLGLSDEDERDINDLIADFVGDVTGGAR